MKVIKIEDETWKQLFNLKEAGESFNEVINKLLKKEDDTKNINL